MPSVPTAEGSGSRCYRCGLAAETAAGTIYVRREVEGRVRAVPICDACWDFEEPGRPPVRARP